MARPERGRTLSLSEVRAELGRADLVVCADSFTAHLGPVMGRTTLVLATRELADWRVPFPGSFYGLPLAAVTALLVAATYAALGRMAGSPAIVHGATTPAARGVDRRWRAISTSVIIRTATASLLLEQAT